MCNKTEEKAFSSSQPKSTADYAREKQLKLRRITQKVVETNARLLIISP
jgi:hypothetical protein